MDNQTYEYAAFVSYRHTEPDKTWAKWLVDTLETYKIPKALRERGYPNKIGKLYRDEDEAHAGAVLGDHIATALDQSRALIIVCTAHTQDSPWVEREIEYFRSLGRGDRIFCLLADGEPETSFPKSLLQRDVDRADALAGPSAHQSVAADVRPTEDRRAKTHKRDATLRLISGVLGCKFDDLKRRDEERERKRKQRNWAVLVVASLAIAISGFWFWDQNRIKSAYYSTMTSQWGQPHGVYQIDAEQFAARAVAFEVKTQGGRTIEVIRKGEPGFQLGIPEPFENQKANRWSVAYEADGDVERITLFDRFNNVIRVDDYEIMMQDNTAFVDFSDASGAILHTSDHDKLASFAEGQQNPTEITRHFLRFDGNGFIVSRLFRNQSKIPKVDKSGIFGHRYTNNDKGIVTSARVVDADEMDVDLGARPVEYVNEINSFGLIVERTNLSASAQLANTVNAYSIVRYQYDDIGNRVAVAFFEASDKPATHRRGYHRITQSFDRQGNLASAQYWNSDNRPAQNNNNYHAWKGSYEGSNLVRSQFRNANLDLDFERRGFAIFRARAFRPNLESRGIPLALVL